MKARARKKCALCVEPSVNPAGGYCAKHLAIMRKAADEQRAREWAAAQEYKNAEASLHRRRTP